MLKAALRIRIVLLGCTGRISGGSESLICGLGVLLGIRKISLPVGQSLLRSLQTIQGLGQDALEVGKAFLRIGIVLLSRTQRTISGIKSLISGLGVFFRCFQNVLRGVQRMSSQSCLIVGFFYAFEKPIATIGCPFGCQVGFSSFLRVGFSVSQSLLFRFKIIQCFCTYTFKVIKNFFCISKVLLSCF